MNELGPTTLLTVGEASSVCRYPVPVVEGWIGSDLLEIEPVFCDRTEAKVQGSNLLECVKDGGHKVSLELLRCGW